MEFLCCNTIPQTKRGTGLQKSGDILFNVKNEERIDSEYEINYSVTNSRNLYK